MRWHYIPLFDWIKIPYPSKLKDTRVLIQNNTYRTNLKEENQSKTSTKKKRQSKTLNKIKRRSQAKILSCLIKFQLEQVFIKTSLLRLQWKW